MGGSALLVWLVRLIVVAIVLRFVLRALAGPRASQRSGRERRPPDRLAGHLVRDPQCGTYVPRDRAVTLGGSAGPHFCSTACRDAWVAAHAAGQAVH